jgi:uncharacterized protein YggE
VAFVVLVLAAALSPQTILAQTPAAPEPPVIVAQGEAILMLPPDRAYAQIAAEARADKIKDAQRMAAMSMSTVQMAIKGVGVPADTIRTLSFSVQPWYENGRMRGHVARNVIEVRVDDLTKLGDIIDAAGATNEGAVSSVRFDLKNRSAAELDALRRAVRDANERAKAIAEGAGQTLGAIVRVQEQRSSSASPVFRAATGGGGGRGGGFAETPIEPGEIQVRATVVLTVGVK